MKAYLGLEEYCDLVDLHPGRTELIKVGKELSRKCREANIPTGDTYLTGGMRVNSYPVKVLEEWGKRSVSSPAPTKTSAPKNTPPKLERYKIGDWVRIKGIEEKLCVIDATIYGPQAQFYQVEHRNRDWTPPNGFVINTNYDRPRLCVELPDILGLAI